MKKNLLILLLFVIGTVQAFAEDDNPFRDEIVQEQRPVPVQTTQPVQDKTSFSKKVKNAFSKKQKIDKANDVDIVEPDEKSIKTNNNQKKKVSKKKLKNKEKDTKKNIKVITSPISDDEFPAVNNNTDNTILTDIAYHGNIETNKIIEVDDCVKLALENHPAIKSAMSNADIYKSRIGQAWANYFPTFSAGVSFSKNDMQVSNFAPAVQKYDMYYVPTLSGNMLLFDFGKTKAQADIAKRSYESAKYSLETSINTVVFNVKQAYYNLLFALQQVKVYEDTVHDYELHLEQANAYYNIGTKAKIDVITAEYNLGKAKLNLLQANNTLKIAYVELSNAMGLPDYTDYDVTDNLTTKAYNIDINDAVNTAYETSPELLAAKKRADASKLLVRASRRSFTPDLTGFASYTRGGKRIDTDEGYQIGAQLSYQTVNLMLLKKQVDEARATYKKDLSDYENSKQNIYLQVKQAYLNMITAQDSIKVAKLSMDQAKEQYDQASGRYKVGLGDAIELKDAETTYRNSQLDYYNSLLNYHVSAADLERLMGVPMKSSDVDLL